eukprot:15333485-Ditylum_brightwellii.AAC.1
MLTSLDAINVIVLPGDKEVENSWSLGTLCGDGVVIPILLQQVTQRLIHCGFKVAKDMNYQE